MKPKNQRLTLVAIAIVAVLGAVLLAMLGLKERAAYFYTPSDVAAGRAVDGKAMRLGGMVEKGSLVREADGVTIGFVVADNILAKHDERYMPPELGNQAAEHKAGKTLAR